MVRVMLILPSRSYCAAGISDEEAIKLIGQDPLADAPVTAVPQAPERKKRGAAAREADTLIIAAEPAAPKRADPFEELLTGYDVSCSGLSLGWALRWIIVLHCLMCCYCSPSLPTLR